MSYNETLQSNNAGLQRILAAVNRLPAAGTGELPEGVPYVETTTAVVMPQTTVEFDPESGMGAYEGVLGLTPGQTVTVEWNGAEYTCVTQAYSEVVDDEGTQLEVGVTFGNVEALNGTGDTGEPFVIAAFYEEYVELFGGSTALLALDGSASAVVSIESVTETAHKLDERCLPDTVPWVEHYGDVIIPGVVLTDNMGTGLNTYVLTEPVGKVTIGATYEVKCGDESWLLTATAPSDPSDHQTLASITAHDASVSIFLYKPDIAAANGTYGLIGYHREHEGKTLSVGAAYTAHKVDERCLMPGMFVVPVIRDDGSVVTYTPAMTFLEVESRVLLGSIPVLWVSDGTNVQAYYMTLLSAEMYFVQNARFNNEGEIVPSATLVWKKDEGISDS